MNETILFAVVSEDQTVVVGKNSNWIFTFNELFDRSTFEEERTNSFFISCTMSIVLFRVLIEVKNDNNIS
jgi:hypothetical protein